MSEFQDALAVHIQGPFWGAEADLLSSSINGVPSRPVRMIFVEQQARAAFGSDKAHLPGTFLALCAVRNVVVQPSDEVKYTWRRSEAAPAPDISTEQAIRDGLRSGTLTLLLLQAKPADLAVNKTDFDCIGGEIILDGLSAELDAANQLASALGLQSPTRLIADATGVGLHGSLVLPWDANPVPVHPR